MQRIGSRSQVMHGNAKMTGGGLKKKDLKYNKHGKIVSKKMSQIAKKYYSIGGHTNNNTDCSDTELIGLDKLKEEQKVQIYSMDKLSTSNKNKIEQLITTFTQIIIILAGGDGKDDIKKYCPEIPEEKTLYIFCHKRCYDTAQVISNVKYIIDNGLSNNIILCEFNFKMMDEQETFKELFNGKIDVIYTDDHRQHAEGIVSVQYIHSLLKNRGKVQKKVLVHRNLQDYFKNTGKNFILKQSVI